MRRTTLTLVAALALLSLVVVGCASAAQQAAQQATGVQVNQSGNQVTVKGTDGTAVTIDSNTPEELKSFPVPQGFKSEGSGTMSSGGDKLAAGSWKGSGQIQTIVDFYKSSLPGQGWKEESTFIADTGGMLNYSKPDGTGLTVTVSKDDGNEITVAVLLGKSSNTPTPKAQPTAKAQATAAPEKTATPEATSTPKAPATGDASILPAELKDVPVPSGFAPIKDKSVRMASGGKFQMAAAEFFGKPSVKDASTFYTSSLSGKGWDIDVESAGESESTYIATNKADPTLHLAVNISEDDAGTRIYVQVTTG